MTSRTSTNGTFPSDPVAAASYYRAHGLLPIRVPYRGKDPSGEDWAKARAGPEDPSTLFRRGQNHNIGLLLGDKSGNLIDIDIDCREALSICTLLLPRTEAQSGRKGAPRSHHWYRVDQAPDKATEKFLDTARDANGKTVVLLELRSSGGQTVAPPSAHEATGEAIVWHGGKFEEPATVPIADLTQAVKTLAAAALLARHWVGEGCRQDAFMALSGGLLRGGWAEDRAETFVRAVALATNDPEERKRRATVRATGQAIQENKRVTGWPALNTLLGTEGETVIKQALLWLGIRQKAGSKKKRLRPPEPFREFPLHTLPEPLKTYIAQSATALGCDPSYLVPPVLTVCASLIGNTRALRLKRSWREPCVLWSAIIGYSGTMKSPAIDQAVHALYRLQDRLRDKHTAAVNKYEADKAAHEQKVAQAKKDSSEPPKEKPPEPPPPLRRILCSDITVEKVASFLEDAPQGTLMSCDELDSWLGSFTRYKSGGSSDRPHWLTFHGARPWLYDRKTGAKPSIYIRRAAVSVLGGIQPDTFARALDIEARASGLGARLLLAWPPRVPKQWTDIDISEEVQEAYEQVLNNLVELEMDRDRDGRPCPFLLKLTPDAYHLWTEFYNEWGREQIAVDGDMAACFAKIEGYACRLSLVHHVVSRVGAMEDCQPVDVESMRAGIDMARWFAYEARRVYSLFDESDEQKSDRKLYEFIRDRGGHITPRELQRSNRRRWPDAATAEQALQELVEVGLGRWEETGPGTKGGRPSKLFRLDPPSESYDPDNDDEDCDGPGGPGMGPNPKGAPDKTDKTPNRGQSESCADPVPPSDKTPQAPDTTTKNQQCLEGFVDFVGRTKEYQPPTEHPSEGLESVEGVLSGASGVLSDDTRYRLIQTPIELTSLLQALDESVLVGLDTETTGLNPRIDHVRLLQLAPDKEAMVYLVDCSAVDPSPLWEILAERRLVIHHAAFDLAFLDQLGFTPGTVHDTYLLAELLHAGTRELVSLAACCQRELNITLDKEHQTDNWIGDLTEDQLAYAAKDAAVLVPLYQALAKQIDQAGLQRVAEIEHRALPCIRWLRHQGVAFDRERWREQALVAEAEATALRQQLNEQAPQRSEEMFAGGFNWDSPAQVKEALALINQKVDNTNDDTLAGIDHPLAEGIRAYRHTRKQCTTYGTDFLKYVAPDERIYADWKQLGAAATGRMSCSSPNLQNLPRDLRYRQCIIAPPGKVLVKADYSQIELRIAAKVANETAMIDAYSKGHDLHVLTAARLLQKTPDQVTKADRQVAKSANFGLLYGQGAEGYRIYAKSNYRVELGAKQAEAYRAAFFQAYPGLAAWHRRVKSHHADVVRTLTGRRRLMDYTQPDTERLNTPIQGTGADGLKQALGLLWERRDQCPGAVPVLAVHDEIVVEVDEGQADTATAWLKQAMLDAMTPLVDPVPVEVEVRIAKTWGGDTP